MRALASSCAYRVKPVVASFLMTVAVLLMIWVAKLKAAKPAVVITMMDMPASFEPTRITIKAGDTVEWRNTGNQLHHVTTDPSAALKKSDVATPAGATPFDSGFMKPGESFSETFAVPGVYHYTCAVHEAKGMNGQVVVQK